MKKVLSTIFVALLVIACAVDYSFAQQRRGQGRGPAMGMRGGFGMGSQADTIADILVLDTERAEALEKALEKQREGMRGEFGNFGNMSQEERRAAFQEMREKMNESLEKAMKDVLTEKEVKAVQPYLSMRGFGFRPDAQLRALRQIELEKETRAKLQTVVLGYFKAVDELRPEREPGQRGGPPEFNRERMQEIREKMDKAHAKMIGDVKGELNEKQIAAWETKTKEVEKEFEEQRQRRGGPREGQRPGRGEGRGPGRGPGRGQQG